MIASTGTVALALTAGTGFSQQIADQPAGRQFIEPVDRLLEQALRPFVELLFGQAEFAGQIGDQLPLLRRALPVAVAVPIAIAVVLAFRRVRR